MAKRVFNSLFIFGLVLFALFHLMPRSVEAMEASQQNSANNDPIVPEMQNIPFLNRFKLKDRMDAAGFDDEEKKSIYRAYKDGRVGEEEYVKFYSPSEKLLAGQSWKRLSFTIYDRPNSNLRLDVSPKGKAVMLKYSLRLDGLKW